MAFSWLVRELEQGNHKRQSVRRIKCDKDRSSRRDQTRIVEFGEREGHPRGPVGRLAGDEHAPDPHPQNIDRPFAGVGKAGAIRRGADINNQIDRRGGGMRTFEDTLPANLDQTGEFLVGAIDKPSARRVTTARSSATRWASAGSAWRSDNSSDDLPAPVGPRISTPLLRINTALA